VKYFIEAHGANYDPELLVHTLHSLIGAGTETTSTFIRWAIVLLANHVSVQERLHAEIDSVIDRQRLPALEDRSRLTWLFNCMHMRNHYVPLLRGRWHFIIVLGESICCRNQVCVDVNNGQLPRMSDSPLLALPRKCRWAAYISGGKISHLPSQGGAKLRGPPPRTGEARGKLSLVPGVAWVADEHRSTVLTDLSAVLVSSEVARAGRHPGPAYPGAAPQLHRQTDTSKSTFRTDRKWKEPHHNSTGQLTTLKPGYNRLPCLSFAF